MKKAVKLAFCNGRCYAFSENGQVFCLFYSPFFFVKEFHGIKIIDISGTTQHIFVVCSDGSVFAVGINFICELGPGENVKRKEQNSHSLFQTED